MGGGLRDAEDVRRSSLYKLDEGWTKELHICGQSDVGLIPNVHIISLYMVIWLTTRTGNITAELLASEKQKENGDRPCDRRPSEEFTQRFSLE